MARNKYPEETRKRIVDTAARLFMEKGYDHTSIQDIIDNLGGLTKGAIYHHFKSKEEIMGAVSDMIYSAATGEMEKVRRRKDLNGKEKLRELFRISVFNPAQKEMFESAPDMMKSPQLLQLYMKELMEEVSTMTYEILKEGEEDGSIQTEYPKELAEVLILTGNIWLNPMIYHCGPAEMAKRMKFYQYMLRKFGLDVIEDQAVEIFAEYARIYKSRSE